MSADFGWKSGDEQEWCTESNAKRWHSGTQHRVIAIQERSVDVMYRDEVQVAARAKGEKE